MLRAKEAVDEGLARLKLELKENWHLQPTYRGMELPEEHCVLLRPFVPCPYGTGRETARSSPSLLALIGRKILDRSQHSDVRQE